MNTYLFQAKFPGKLHYSASKIDGNRVYTVQFTLETIRGKRVEVAVDYEKKTISVKNKLFKVVHSEFTERTIMDLQ